MTPSDKKMGAGSGVGQPQTFYLNDFGEKVMAVFGDPPYLVGSATQGKKWRDVDVRVILSDDEWTAWGFGHPRDPGENWAVICMAFAVLGKAMTGLPIDFQIQQQTDANARFKGKREALIWHYRKEGAHP